MINLKFNTAEGFGRAIRQDKKLFFDGQFMNDKLHGIAREIWFNFSISIY
jgi:hypothetical protein